MYQAYVYYQQQTVRKAVDDYTFNQGYANKQQKAEHEKQMDPPRVIKVNEEIYVAVGYTLGNSIMLIGVDGVVIIDTTESLKKSKEIAEAFRNITDKPVKGIIYTHNHMDHVAGTKAFIGDQKNIDIWAHHTFLDIYFHSTARVGMAHAVRAFHQFGVLLGEGIISAGLGSRLELNKNIAIVIVPPNKFLRKEQQTITIAGMELNLMHVPGETDDQIAVFWPKHNALLGTDNLYKAFPNLYAIRGTPFRSLKQWYESLDKMRRLNSDYFVMSHHEPLIGKQLIRDTMMEYRDAIQLVHDQTVRFINVGLHPDEIATRIKLPKHSMKNEFLKEIYGTVRWSSKGLFAGYMGWFSGDIAELEPMLPTERSKRIVDLAGGVERILLEAEKALMETKDPKWALYLSDACHKVFPDNSKAREIKAKALLDMAELQTSHNGYNYYKTAALVTLGQASPKPGDASRKSVIENASLREIFHLLSLRFKADDELCSSMNKIVKFDFPDVKQEVRFQVRNGVIDMSGIYEERKDDITVTVDSVVWRAILNGEWKTDIDVEPSVWELKAVMNCIEKN